MNRIEIQKQLPADLARAVSGYDFRQIHLGLSPSRVFRLTAKNKPPLYLKIAPRTAGFSLLQEKLKLEWLAPRPLPVPEVLLFIPEEAADYLLLSEIPGAPASDDALKQDVPRLIEQLADGLHTIHGLPIEDCPFPAQSDLKIETARQRMLDKLIDESDFDEIRHGETAEKLFGELVATAPAEEDLVFTHGDYCLPNVLLENGKVSGFVDWGNAGIADRYQDIALLARSVRYNFSADWTKFLFDTLGIEPDLKKIDFYQLLDEFF